MQQSLKIWEEFAQNYTNLFVNAMEKSVKQSEEFQKQMSEAVEQSAEAGGLWG
ncbi:MAG: hypothetical protein R2932_46435 [Caldilineaceae bacterium]